MNQEHFKQRNFLIEFEEKDYDLEILKSYNDFLIECSQKDYTNIATHRHHILPKGFMGGSDKKQNLITLSISDHFNAHLILANCFYNNDVLRNKNYLSAQYILAHVKRYLKKNNIKYYEEVTEILEFANLTMAELTSGKNNYMYGKTHTDEVRQIISNVQKKLTRTDEWKTNHSLKVSGQNNGRYGKPFVHSEKSKQQISDTLKLRFREKYPLEHDVFECNEIIDGKLKTFFRKCPEITCNIILYYNSRWAANDSSKKCRHCIKCALIKSGFRRRGTRLSETHKDKLRGPRGKSKVPYNRDTTLSKNSNAKTIMDLFTNKIYFSIKECAIDLNVSVDKINADIRRGKFLIIGKTNAKSK